MTDRPTDGAGGADRGGERDDRDLAELLAELESTVDALGTELRAERRGRGLPPLPTPRRTDGLPRPPSPREFLRFADEYAIPAAIATLEANVRALELLQGAIRLLDAGAEGRERGQAASARAVETTRTTLDRLDTALEDLGEALAGTPTDPEARSLLEDARRLRREIDDRLEEGDGGDRTEPVEVDVDAELRSLKDQLDDDGEE